MELSTPSQDWKERKKLEVWTSEAKRLKELRSSAMRLPEVSQFVTPLVTIAGSQGFMSIVALVTGLCSIILRYIVTAKVQRHWLGGRILACLMLPFMIISVVETLLSWLTNKSGREAILQKFASLKQESERDVNTSESLELPGDVFSTVSHGSEILTLLLSDFEDVL
jgi:hypothetical protein